MRAEDIGRGVARLLGDLGCAVLSEFRLGNGRRLDLVGLDGKGRFTGVEIKSGLPDLRADGKWPEYLPYCDRFYFAVGPHFPLAELPAEGGIIVADPWRGEIVRPAMPAPVNAARRKAQTLAFARIAAQRLAYAFDPRFPISR